MKKYRCIVCGFKTLSMYGQSEICPVCFWEDEGSIEDTSRPTNGPNGNLSVDQARQNYMTLGAVEEKFIKKVRSPREDEH